MFNQDDILIIGDSFAVEREKKHSWPKILTKLLLNDHYDDRPPRGKGFPGCSWWSIRRRLLEELKITVPEILIICHTEPNRIPSEYDFPLNIKSVEDLKIHINNNLDDDSKLSPSYIKEIQTAALMYYHHLHSLDYSLWAQTRWFYELDEIAKNYDIPYVIHLHCFKQIEHYIFKNGLTAEETLWENSKGFKLWKEDPLSLFDNTLQELTNHFTIEENLKLANSLYNTILTYSVGPRKIGL
jgi:hypothetical protein